MTNFIDWKSANLIWTFGDHGKVRMQNKLDLQDFEKIYGDRCCFKRKMVDSSNSIKNNLNQFSCWKWSTNCFLDTNGLVMPLKIELVRKNWDVRKLIVTQSTRLRIIIISSKTYLLWEHVRLSKIYNLFARKAAAVYCRTFPSWMVNFSLVKFFFDLWAVWKSDVNASLFWNRCHHL